MVLNHGFPPILTDIVLQFNPVLSVIVYSAEAIIDFAGGKYKPILLSMGNYFFENFFVLCHGAKVKKNNIMTRGRGDGWTGVWEDGESGGQGEGETGRWTTG
jgi:hypothetical protein